MLDADIPKHGASVRYGGYDAASSASSVSSFSLRALISILLRRWWIVALSLAVSFGAALVANKVLPRAYTATSQVMLEDRELRVVDIESIVSGIRLDPSAISSELTILASHQLLKAVSEKLDLANDPEFLSAEEAADADNADQRIRMVVDNLRERTEVNQIGLSYVIEIAVTTRDPALSALIANTITDQYIQNQLDAKFEATRRATQYLSDKVESLRVEVQSAERAVERFKSQQIAGDRQSPEALDRQIEDLSIKLIEAQESFASTKARLEEAERLVAAEGAASASSLVGTPVMTTLKTTLAELRRRAADLSTRYGPRHPRMINLRGEIADTQTAITQEVGKTVQSLRSDHAVATARLSTLQTTLGEIETLRSGQSEGSLELRELERVAEASRLVYETFLKRFTETNEATGIKEADARPVSVASPPTEPSSPKTKLLLAAAGVIGLALGVALALIVEFSVATFRTIEELEFQTGLPIIASMPSIRDGLLKIGAATPVLWRGEIALLKREQKRLLSFVSYFHRRPNSAMAEAVRKVHASIKTGPRDEERGRVVMVTSSVPAEGKSTLSSLLAKSAAARGERVVLVDCDLRSPSFASAAGGRDGADAPDVDIVDVLADEADWEKAVTADKRFECDLLYPSKGTAMAGDLIARRSFTTLIEALRGRYDLVVLDAPPAVAVSDALTIGRLSDTILYGVRWGFAARTTVLRGVKELESGGVPIHGMIFTMVDNIREAKLRDPAAARDLTRLRKYYNS